MFLLSQIYTTLNIPSRNNYLFRSARINQILRNKFSLRTEYLINLQIGNIF